VKQGDAGKALLDEASGIRPAGAARGKMRWRLITSAREVARGGEQVERALAADSDFLPALATKTQLLYGMRRFSEAYEVSLKLIAKVPDDPNLLFYHAKIAHEAHAYKAEVAALEKLIAQADEVGRPIADISCTSGRLLPSWAMRNGRWMRLCFR